MKRTSFTKLSATLQQRLPGTLVQNGLLLFGPVRPLIRAVLFENSGSSRDSFYVWVFVMLPSVPAKYLCLNMGKRLRHPNGGEKWNATDQDLEGKLEIAIREQALPFLTDLQTVEDIPRKAGPFLKNLHVVEMVAHSFAQLGDFEAARTQLDQLASGLTDDIPWQKEMAVRANMLRQSFLQAGETQQLLRRWEVETLASLKLRESGQPS